MPRRIIGRLAVALLAACATGPTQAEQPAQNPAAETPSQPTTLMDFLGAAAGRKALDSAGLLIYGYVEGGFMGRLTGGQDPLPARVFDADKPNNLRLNQLKLTLERPIDRTRTLDVGGRADLLYGTDARFVHSLGLTDNTCNAHTQADLEQLHLQVFLGRGNKQGEGLDIVLGKFATTLGTEVIDAPANCLFSRGLLFNYAIPFAHTGVKANYSFGPQASAYLGVVRGWDNWNDNNSSPSYMVGGTLSTARQVGGGPRASLAMNVITGPEQDDNTRDYRTVIDLALTFRWTDRLTQVLNFDYGTEADGAGTSTAHWGGLSNLLTYALTDWLSATWRAEWLRDADGVRTGIRGNLYEMTVGLTIQPMPAHSVMKNVSVRPELRWDFSDDGGVFGGGRTNQLTAGFDVIIRF